MKTVNRMSGTAAVLAAFFGLALAAAVAEGEPASVVFRGWDAVSLSNQYVSLTVVPSIGGRVMQIENLLAMFEVIRR